MKSRNSILRILALVAVAGVDGDGSGGEALWICRDSPTALAQFCTKWISNNFKSLIILIDRVTGMIRLKWLKAKAYGAKR